MNILKQIWPKVVFDQNWLDTSNGFCLNNFNFTRVCLASKAKNVSNLCKWMISRKFWNYKKGYLIAEIYGKILHLSMWLYYFACAKFQK